jgi:Tol biopolymer transport system component
MNIPILSLLLNLSNLILFLVLPVTLYSNEIQSPFITEVHPLVFAGKRSGEGYFSKDGKEIVFQSERFLGNPFYQIYLMDLKSGRTDLISTGEGQTTCAWIHPIDRKVLFSSTHLDPNKDKKKEKEWEERKDPKRAYSWDFDETYDIFVKDLNSNQLTRLTESIGYDAEGSFSPDGKKIVFASNRSAYNETLSDFNREILKKDPSYFMELYMMNEDGTNLERLTFEDGYDGGPFFSFDGKSITWRRFSKDGGTAEIYTMNLKERKPKQITKLKAMSWAPFFHPSGKYIIFASNLEGFQNFELYLVDSLGKKSPIRITDAPGFDGLPVFLPNGREISWTRRDSTGNSRIFVGNWDHEKALSALGLYEEYPTHLILNDDINENDLKSWVYYLSSKKLNGRPTGSTEESLYTSKIISFFEEWKLSKINSSFKHTFPFLANVKLGKDQSFQLDEMKLVLGKDYIPRSFSKQGTSEKSEIVFAGYGIRSASTEKFKEYDSYKGLDIKDKWVLLFKGVPSEIEGEFRSHLNYYAQIQQKITVAKTMSARGILFISEEKRNLSKQNQKITPNNLEFTFERGIGESDLYVLDISPAIAEKLLKEPLSKTKKLWEKETTPGGKVLDYVVQVEVSLEKIISEGSNIVGFLGNPELPTILIGAHGDHLGQGKEGNSLAKEDEKDIAHRGADDNASGVAVVLELAQYFANHPQEIPKNHSLAFGIWSGEEMGNLGSTSFAKKNLLKLKTYINLDMVGRLRNSLFVQGIGSSEGWDSLIESINVKNKLPIVLQSSPYLPTDAMSFYVHSEIPILSLFTGSHEEYHTPRDTAEKINFKGLFGISHFCKDIVKEIPNIAIGYKKSESEKTGSPMKGLRSYLGTIPDYSQEGVVGVKIAGTTKGSPAETAGLKQGDIIIEFSGTKISNIYDYVNVLQSVKPGKETTIKVLRNGKEMDWKITPMVKE